MKNAVSKWWGFIHFFRLLHKVMIRELQNSMKLLQCNKHPMNSEKTKCKVFFSNSFWHLTQWNPPQCYIHANMHIAQRCTPHKALDTELCWFGLKGLSRINYTVTIVSVLRVSLLNNQPNSMSEQYHQILTQRFHCHQG